MSEQSSLQADLHKLTGRQNDDKQKNDDAGNQAHAHLHVLRSEVSIEFSFVVKRNRKRHTFHHICFRTRLAPRRNPWADTARLSVLSWRASRRSPRCETLLMFSLMTPTVSSICCHNVRTLLTRHKLHGFRLQVRRERYVQPSWSLGNVTVD